MTASLSDTPLTDLFPPAWFDREVYAGVQCGFYSSALAAHSDRPQIQNSVEALLSAGLPVQVSLLRLTNLEVVSCETQVIYTSGERQFDAKIDKASLPPGDYVLISAPCGAHPTGEFEARERIRAARGALLALYGHSSAEYCGAWLFLNADGTASYTSSTHESYLSPDDFNFVPGEWLTLLAERSPYLPKDIKQRLDLALGFLERSAGLVDPIARFSNSWIALEISSQGKPDRLIKALTTDGRKSGLLGELDIARNDLFHRGQTPKLSPDAERALILATLSDVLLRVGVSPAALKTKLIEIDESHQVGRYSQGV